MCSSCCHISYFLQTFKSGPNALLPPISALRHVVSSAGAAGGRLCSPGRLGGCHCQPAADNSVRAIHRVQDRIGRAERTGIF